MSLQNLSLIDVFFIQTSSYGGRSIAMFDYQRVRDHFLKGLEIATHGNLRRRWDSLLPFTNAFLQISADILCRVPIHPR